MATITENKIHELNDKIEYYKNENEMLFSLLHLTSIINSSENIDDLLGIILKEGLNSVNGRNGSIMLLDEGDNCMRIRVAVGLSDETIKNTGVRLGESISGNVLKENYPYLHKYSCNDFIVKGKLNRKNPERDKSFMCVPLASQKKLLGVINISDPGLKDSFSERDFGIMIALSSLAAIAIEKSELYSRYNRFMYETILSLAQAIEAKDTYTEGHCHRVAIYSYLIGREYGSFSEEDLMHLQYSAILHDIGKIGIDAGILNKNGPLSDTEYNEVKKHVLIGENIISPISNLSIVKKCIKFHHKWYNGSGYPSDDVHDEKAKILSNIIGVADVYDAITSDRAYRKKMDYFSAKNLLIEGKGIQFDPIAVDILIKQIEDNHLF